MFRFSALIVALAWVLAFSTDICWARDKNGGFTAYNDKSCRYYLDAYSQTTLKRSRTMKGPHEAWGVFGWISGYLSAYNAYFANGKSSILGSMTTNDARRWIAAWCRDKPSKDVHDAASALTKKLER